MKGFCKVSLSGIERLLNRWRPYVKTGKPPNYAWSAVLKRIISHLISLALQQSKLVAHIASRELKNFSFFKIIMQEPKNWEIKIQRSTEIFSSGKRIGWHISWLTGIESVMELLSCPITDRSTITRKLRFHTEQSICSPVSSCETVAWSSGWPAYLGSAGNGRFLQSADRYHMIVNFIQGVSWVYLASKVNAAVSFISELYRMEILVELNQFIFVIIQATQKTVNICLEPDVLVSLLELFWPLCWLDLWVREHSPVDFIGCLFNASLDFQREAAIAV